MKCSNLQQRVIPTPSLLFQIVTNCTLESKIGESNGKFIVAVQGFCVTRYRDFWPSNLFTRGVNISLQKGALSKIFLGFVIKNMSESICCTSDNSRGLEETEKIAYEYLNNGIFLTLMSKIGPISRYLDKNCRRPVSSPITNFYYFIIYALISYWWRGFSMIFLLRYKECKWVDMLY